jgi:AcrR family transcriptional regulator
MEMGFQGTSIDDVARRLGATKGRIYHYYASKTDLFFDVHREGMRRLNEAVNAVMDNDGNGRETLRAMLEAHALTMLQNIAYLAVVVQGVHMHRLGATTLAQRQVLDEIMAIRRDFEKLFADVFRRGREDGSIREHIDRDQGHARRGELDRRLVSPARERDACRQAKDRA